jgi:outer membrane protein TolC
MHADELANILSDNKNKIFDYQFENNELESDMLSRSWMNPVKVQYRNSLAEQFMDDTRNTKIGSWNVIIDQPIFRSGGIYYGIKYADALRDANSAEIMLQKRTMIANAVSILFNLKKTQLEAKKLNYQVKNDAIDIKQKRDSYDAGVLDSSFLDQAILKKSQDETAQLQLEITQSELMQQFAALSTKDPKDLALPKLTLMSKSKYSADNLELKRDQLRAKQSNYNQKVTWAKYLPAVSLQGQYTDSDINPLWDNGSLKEKYYTYGLTVSMPIDVNMFADIEASKVKKLQAAVEAIDRKETVGEEYDWIANSLGILEKKINLAQKDAKVYQNLYRLTKDLAKAGDKTPLDAEVMQNSLQIRNLDQQIYEIEKQLLLLKLYARMDHAV